MDFTSFMWISNLKAYHLSTEWVGFYMKDVILSPNGRGLEFFFLLAETFFSNLLWMYFIHSRYNCFRRVHVGIFFCFAALGE